MVAALTALALGGCSGHSSKDKDCLGGKCDGFDLPEADVPTSPCDGVIRDKSGRGLGNSKIAGRLNDPLANLAFRVGSDCPTTFDAIMKKIEKNAIDGGDNNTTCNTAGKSSMLVTETAQVLGTPTSYRSVTSIGCSQTAPTPGGGLLDGGVPDPNLVLPPQPGGPGISPPFFPFPPIGGGQAGLLFSLFGIQPGLGLPNNVEIIAFDSEQGVFNYYETDGSGGINFFGTSKDMLKGPDSNDVRRCAGCHTGGGLIMKELDAPWLHWEGDTTTPGADELFAEQETLLGSHSNGIEMENIVRSGNRTWNQSRLDHLRALGVTREILRPLFCNVEINIASASSSPQDSTVGTATFANLSRAIFDQRVGFGSLNFDAGSYDAVLRSNGQFMAGLPEKFIETHFGLSFVIPSAADEDYGQKLLVAKIIDQELLEDILMVDFTRSVFSDDRCGLLEFVPQLDAATLSADGIREGMIENLGAPAEGTPEMELLRNLSNPGDDASKTVQDFSAACGSRMNEKALISFDKDGTAREQTVPAGLVDYMKIISINRELARELRVMEFPQTLPSDTLKVAKGTRLDPTNCKLTDSFIPVARDPALTCSGRCGEAVQTGAPCQCDDDCQAAGNCCEDFAGQCIRSDCSHSVCEIDEASPLTANCLPVTAGVPADCVTDICQADSFCCMSGWDQSCQNQVASICGFTCPTPVPAPSAECCKVCTSSQPCGDSCISNSATCNQAPGCACDANGNPPK